ncbi:MAG TPA: hypothetical protein VMT81_01755 [Candidatus Paceibacterota bacterium]|nr:hypothetical protein [Candidatus Paceibacterota bacterium]
MIFHLAWNGSGFVDAYNFKNGPIFTGDGAYPYSLIMGKDGNLYGTTFGGPTIGENGGTIFMFTPGS